MRTGIFLRFTLALLVIAFSFVVGVVIGGRQGWLQPIVRLTIVNQSGGPLADLEVRYKSSQQAGTLQLPPLQHRDRVVASFLLTGEGEYLVVGKLSDGSTITQGSGYVEPGYSAMEVLLAPQSPTQPASSARQ
jgi:hypothetical protein